MIVTRTLVFRAKLSRRTHASLEAFLEEMRHLWNAALEERIDAYRKAGVSITWVDQFKALTEIRRAVSGYALCSLEAQRSVLKRLDRAFQSFFRRHAAGQKPGFPRFRSRRRSVRSFDVPAPKIHRKGRWNTVSVKGIGKFRFAGEIDARPRGCGSSRPPSARPCRSWWSGKQRTSLIAGLRLAWMPASAIAPPCRAVMPFPGAGWTAPN